MEDDDKNRVDKFFESIRTPERLKEERSLSSTRYPTNIMLPTAYANEQELKDSGLVDDLWSRAQLLADNDRNGTITQQELMDYIKTDLRISHFVNEGGLRNIDTSQGFPQVTKADYDKFFADALKAGGGKLGLVDADRDGKFTKDDVPLNALDLTGVEPPKKDDYSLHGGIGLLDPLLMSVMKHNKPEHER